MLWQPWRSAKSPGDTFAPDHAIHNRSSSLNLNFSSWSAVGPVYKPMPTEKDLTTLTQANKPLLAGHNLHTPTTPKALPPDSYPLPKVDNFVQHLKSTWFISTLGLTKVGLFPRSKAKNCLQHIQLSLAKPGFFHSAYTEHLPKPHGYSSQAPSSVPIHLYLDDVIIHSFTTCSIWGRFWKLSGSQV